MIIIRDTFQAKYGRGDELVALFKELQLQWAGHALHLGPQRFRILTDASGPFFTVVTEVEVENLAAWERTMVEEFALPGFGDWFARMTPLVESGRRDFYNLVWSEEKIA